MPGKNLTPDEVAAAEAEIESVVRELRDTPSAIGPELERRGLAAIARRYSAQQRRGMRLRNAWGILLGWVFLGIWVFALIRSWQAGLGWFLFWLFLGPFIVATTMGFLGLRERARKR